MQHSTTETLIFCFTFDVWMALMTLKNLFQPFHQPRIWINCDISLYFSSTFGWFSDFCQSTFGLVIQNFFGGSNVIFVPSLYYFWPKKRFFLPFSRFFLHQKNLASFLVILVQVYFPSQGTQKSLYTGLPHHFGIVQSYL